MLCEKSRAHNLEWYEIVALARFCLTAPAHDWDGESDDKVSDSESEFNGCTDQSLSDSMSFWEEVDNHLGCLSSLCKAHPAVAIPILMQLAGDERIDLFRRAALVGTLASLTKATTKALPEELNGQVEKFLIATLQSRKYLTHTHAMLVQYFKKRGLVRAGAVSTVRNATLLTRAGMGTISIIANN